MLIRKQNLGCDSESVSPQT